MAKKTIGFQALSPTGNQLAISQTALSPATVAKAASPTEIINTLALAAVSMYEGEIDPVSETRVIQPEYLGKTNLEVMSLQLMGRAARGDLAAINMVYDRLIGKPKQFVESTNLNVSYSDWLDSLDATNNTQVVDAAPATKMYQPEYTNQPNPQTPKTGQYESILSDDDPFWDEI